MSVHIALGFCHNFHNIQIFMVYGCSGVHSSLPSITKGMMQISVHMIRLKSNAALFVHIEVMCDSLQ